MNESKEPLLHLQFNELINENDQIIVHDETRHKHHAVVKGEDITVMPSDAFGSCLSFDGNDWLEIDHRLQYQPSSTIAFWIDPEDIQREQCFFGKLDVQKETAFWFGCRDHKFFIKYGTEEKELGQPPISTEKWFHSAIVLKELDQKFHASIYIDGVLFETVTFDTIIELADGESWKIGHVNTDEQDYFKGNIDDVLFYHSALNVEEIKGVKELAKTAQSTFSSTHPIAFDLISDDVNNVLYIANEGNAQQLVLEITNASANTIVFEKIKEESTIEKGHFELLFRPQTFESTDQKTGDKDWKFINDLVLPESWKANMARLEPTDQTVSFSFYYDGDTALELASGSTLRFEMEYGNADGSNGGRGTQVVLNYQQILYKETKTPFKGMRNKQVDIVSQRGKRNIPLHAGFIGTNTILNFADKETAGEKTTSDITIRLFNTLKKGSLQFNDSGEKKATRFILSFDAMDNDRALCNDDEMKAIEIELLNDWGSVTKSTQGQHAQFVIDSLRVQELTTDTYLDLKINNIRSSKPSGFSNIYIHYENIIGYWDGEFVLAVEKTPLVHKSFATEKSVGVGMNPNEEYRLSVGGNLKIEADPDYNEVVSITDKEGIRNYLSINKEGGMEVDGEISGKKEAGSLSTLQIKGSLNTSKKIQEGGYDLMPSGAIIMWAKREVPEGWKICNGSNDTPDLRDRFVVGAGSDYSLGNKGGANHVTLSESQMPSHNHGYDFSVSYDGKHSHTTSYELYGNDSGTSGAHNISKKSCGRRKDFTTARSGSHSHSISGNISSTGGNQPHENRPPYYALYYIMKL